MNLSQMIIVLGKVRTFSGLEKKISSEQFENHARETPNISGGGVVDPKYHLKCIYFTFKSISKNLRGTILSCLDFCGEVMMSPAGVAQVCDFDSDIFIYSCTSAIPTISNNTNIRNYIINKKNVRLTNKN